MTEPRTEAGRRLLTSIAYHEDPARYLPGDRAYWHDIALADILAIEAEAAAGPRDEAYGWHADGDLCRGPECLNIDETTGDHSTDVHSDEWWDGYTEHGRRAAAAAGPRADYDHVAHRGNHEGYACGLSGPHCWACNEPWPCRAERQRAALADTGAER